MTKQLTKLYWLWRKITWPTDDKDLIIVEYKGDKYQVIEMCQNIGQAVEVIIGCSQCQILEILKEEEIRIINIIETWKKS